MWFSNHPWVVSPSLCYLLRTNKPTYFRRNFQDFLRFLRKRPTRPDQTGDVQSFALRLESRAVVPELLSDGQVLTAEVKLFIHQPWGRHTFRKSCRVTCGICWLMFVQQFSKNRPITTYRYLSASRQVSTWLSLPRRTNKLDCLNREQKLVPTSERAQQAWPKQLFRRRTQAKEDKHQDLPLVGHPHEGREHFHTASVSIHASTNSWRLRLWKIKTNWLSVFEQMLGTQTWSQDV